MTIPRTILAAVIAVAIASVAFAQDDSAAATKPTTQASGPVDFRKLKEALPETLASIKRTEATGEKTAFGEMKFSQARASYVKDADSGDAPRIEVQILDYGANAQMIEAMSAWTKVEIDSESDGGYQKTTKVGEHPAMEQYQNESKTGILQLFVAGRFFVTVNTTNLSVEDFKKLGEELKLEKLAALK